MAQYTAYVNYIIFFSDPAEYAAAVAYCGGTGYGHCPATAKTQFGLTYITGPLEGVPRGIYGLAPFGIPNVPPGFNVMHPLPSGVFLIDTVDSVLVPGQLPAPPLTPAGPDMLLVWWGYIIKINAQEGGSTPPSGTPIPQRRFIGGCEIHGNNAEGGSGAGSPVDVGHRGSSRTIDGQGLPIRGAQPTAVWTKQQDEYIAGLTPKTTWERFYVRVNTFGTNILGVWQGAAKVNTLITASIRIDNATGVIKIYTTTSGGVETLRGTGATALVLGTWYLIDVIILFNNGAGTDGRFRVWINHTLELDYTDNTGGSLDTNDTHSNSRLGRHTASESVWNVDLDDWIAADPPNQGGVEHLDSVDWQSGSHVRHLNWASSVHTNFTGNVGTCSQHQNPELQASSQMASTTALATVEAVAELPTPQDYPGQVYGIAAIWLGAYTYQNPLGNGRIGYNVNLGGYVYLATTDSSVLRYASGSNIYRPALLSFPQTVTSFSIIKEKPNDAVSNLMNALAAVAEYIGVWGPEDQAGSADFTNSTKLYQHNARYANTEWGNTVMGPSTAPCYSVGGTYVGNGTVQSINLPAPCHFLWGRALTGGSLGIKCFGASLGGHDGPAERFRPMNPVRLYVDSASQCKFTVCGANAESNAIGVTYQYIAFCDPGMRFSFCGTYNAPSALATMAIPLFVSDFLAAAGFIQKDVIGSTTTAIDLTYKGVGNAGNAGQTLAGIAQATWGSFAAGALTVLASNISAFRAQYNFSLWRTTDPDCNNVAVQIHSYTGDGNALQIVNLPLTTGRFPLLAIVVPHNAVAWFRDPSHTGVNSANATTLANGLTSIMGGAKDQIFVGITLNTLGIVYDVFVIMGDSAAWNNGTFYLSNCIPKGTWTPPTFAPSSEPTIVGDGGAKFDGDLTPISMFKTISGIYVLVPDKHTDTFYTGAGATSIEDKIPDPIFKTGYVGG